jgi:Major Facilitator Superfamily
MSQPHRDSLGENSKESIPEGGEYVENQIHPQATYFNETTSRLTPAHRDYLLRRHGTFDLDPIPDMGDADSYNWATWMVYLSPQISSSSTLILSLAESHNLVLVVIHACMSTFTAASIIPAYENIAADLGVSLQRTIYLTSLQIAILGVAPLIWKPFSNNCGRRSLFLISLACSLVGNIGCAKSPSYSSMAVCRAIVAFFISPAAAIGSAVVTETFFKKKRATYMGIWTLMVTLGVPIAPFIFGFVAYHVGYRWIYWILAMVSILPTRLIDSNH